MVLQALTAVSRWQPERVVCPLVEYLYDDHAKPRMQQDQDHSLQKTDCVMARVISRIHVGQALKPSSKRHYRTESLTRCDNIRVVSITYVKISS